MMNKKPTLQTHKRFCKDERQSLYDVIHHRRDVRQFRPECIPEEVLLRILNAAHAAPSVGYMQPWNFILIQDQCMREKIAEHVQQQNSLAAQHYSEEKRALYDSLKLEGIVESPLNIVVTYNPKRGGPHVLGRNTMPETGLFSVCCAIQNLWLAARAENIGVGWVSILEPDIVKSILHIPKSIQLIAYLCVGYPKVFFSIPELEQKGWRQKIPLHDLCYVNRWEQKKEK